MNRTIRPAALLFGLALILFGSSRCKREEFDGDSRHSQRNPASSQNTPLPPPTQADQTKTDAGGGVIWSSDAMLSKDGPLETEKGNGSDKVLYPSHAGEGAKKFAVENGFLTWDGNRTRVYFDFYQIKPLVNSELEFYAEKTEAVDNVSTKVGNHSMDGQYTFGGYGCSFHAEEVESKVEYFHNDQGDGESVKGEAMPAGKLIGYKVQKQNVAGSDEVVMNCYVDYNGDGNWKLAMKDRRWTKKDWKPGGKVPDAKDASEIENGPYRGNVHRWWIRINGEASGKVKVKNIKIREIGEAQN
ncbi:MAG: hypothetical protein AB7T49_08070 [Oligoflexales bacterium]